MDYSNIHARIEQLNLKWQEYDFGDTLYAEIPISIFSSQTSIVEDCETQKYKIKFQDNGYVLTFKEKEEVSFVTKIIAMLRTINSTVSQSEISQDRAKDRVVNIKH